MEYQQLGPTELYVSRLCFGCWAIGGHGWGPINDSTSVSSIHRALDLGINFFDTADVYGFGHSEAILSKALGARRHDLVIATKFGVSWTADGSTGRDCSPVYMVHALEASLRRLRLDCIPLYQIHWPDPLVPLDETLAALKKCQEAGKIRYIGCSNFPQPLLREAAASGLLCSVQMPYSILSREPANGYVQLCQSLGIGFMAYGVLEKGLLSGDFPSLDELDAADRRARDANFQAARLPRNLEIHQHLRSIGMKYDKSPAQTAIRFVLDHPAVSAALVGIIEPRHIEENIGAMDWHLSADDWSFLARY